MYPREIAKLNRAAPFLPISGRRPSDGRLHASACPRRSQHLRIPWRHKPDFVTRRTLPWQLIMHETYDVLIIGGGFSGAILACQLARYRKHDLRVGVVERKGEPGRGVAYGTACEQHLLNVTADHMSAFPESPDHFVDWLRENFKDLARSNSFPPRRVFGQYVGEILSRACADTSVNLKWIEDSVISIHQIGHLNTAECASGIKLSAKYIVLATGNFPPAEPLLSKQGGNPIHAAQPWSDEALEAMPAGEAVLLLGSGLTAIDHALAFHAAGFRGHIYMLSRRGMLPHVHRNSSRWPAEWTKSLPNTVRGVLQAVRREAVQAVRQGKDWRDVIDSLRPSSQNIWQGFPLEEKRRFLRHVRPYWEVHRHRCAPEVQLLLDHLRAVKRLTVIAGRVLDCSYEPGAVSVRYRLRKTGEESKVRVCRIVNCTGPDAVLRDLRDPLIQSLIGQGMARPDPLSLGLDVATDGALIDRSGVPSRALFTIGPPRKAALWETTAVPEIRSQAETLAKRLLAELKGSS